MNKFYWLDVAENGVHILNSMNLFSAQCLCGTFCFRSILLLFLFTFFFFFIFPVSILFVRSFTRSPKKNSLQSANCKASLLPVETCISYYTFLWNYINENVRKKGTGEEEEEEDEAEDVLRWCIRSRHSTHGSRSHIHLFFFFLFKFALFCISGAKGAKEEDNIWSIVCKCSECTVHLYALGEMLSLAMHTFRDVERMQRNFG